MRKREGIRVLEGRGSVAEFSGVSHVLICCFSDDVTGFIACYASSFPDPGRLLVFCVGVSPDKMQVAGLAFCCGDRKVLIASPSDLLGRVAALKVAVWLKNKDVLITYLLCGQIEVTFKSRVYLFAEHRLSLSAFEKASGFRSKFRTRKIGAGCV